jgi:hypothetical protein
MVGGAYHRWTTVDKSPHLKDNAPRSRARTESRVADTTCHQASAGSNFPTSGPSRVCPQDHI